MSARDPESKRNTARRAGSIAAQALLILITAALTWAILLPAIVGPSEQKQKRDQRQWLRSLR